MSSVKLTADSGGGTVALTAPSSTTSNAAVELTLPVDDGTAGQILQTDGSGNLTWVDKPTPGITEADQWRLTTHVQGDVDPITGTWERNDTSGFTKIGTGLTESSGVFSYPSTGIWQITAVAKSHHSSANKWSEFMLYTTIDDSTWVKQTEPGGSNHDGGGNTYANSTFTFIFDVTNTTNCKTRFAINQENSSAYLTGSSSFNCTHITFVRLGDT